MDMAREGVTKPKYRTQQHKYLRAKYEPIVQAGLASCCETICIEERDGRSRWIAPGPWHLAHTDDGLAYKGPAHVRCNSSEGASRGNAMRGKKQRRRVL